MDEVDRRFPPVHDQARKPEFFPCGRWCHLLDDPVCGSSADELHRSLPVDVLRFLAVVEFCGYHPVAAESRVHWRLRAATGSDAQLERLLLVQLSPGQE
jgi:hypothetical protein